MKVIAVLCCFLASGFLYGEEPKINFAEVKSAPNFLPAEHPERFKEYIGKIVVIRITGRTPDSWAYGSKSDGKKTYFLVQHATERRGARTTVSFYSYVPTEGAAWFQKVPGFDPLTGRGGTRPISFYARIIADGKVDALGVKVVSGIGGERFVWE